MRDGLLVEPLQLGIGHVLDLGGLMEQFAVEHFPAERVGELAGHFAAAGAVLASDGNDFHPSGSRLAARKQAPPGIRFSWRGLALPIFPLPKENPLGRGHQQRLRPLRLMANPIAA